MIAQLCACDMWTNSVNAKDIFLVPTKVVSASVTFEAAATFEDDHSDILRSRALEQEVLDILDA
jgi:hypothetical protein